jgi:isopentenyl-diphosphate Delta-isomerase
MNMKYGAIFILFATIVLGGCLIVENLIAQMFLVYVSFSFLACGIAYVLKEPRFWQKQENGTIRATSFLLFAPMHGLNWFSLLLAVRLEREKAVHEIVPNLWLGRRLISSEADIFPKKSEVAVLDLTGEFPENKFLRNNNYLCLSVLDHTAPSRNQLTQAIAFINNHILKRSVFVHCALGHGRSATVVAAWLLEQNKSQKVEAVLNQIRAIRPGVLLDADQISILKELLQTENQMSEEIFDVVNGRDEVIDAKPRSEVHARGLLHRAVHVLVFNSRGEIFLQKRSMKKDRQPGVWDSSSSGHVDSGEHYDETAVRELREEIGLDLKSGTRGTRPSELEKLFKIDACAETDAEFVWIYRCENEGPFQLHHDEIETGGWFAPEKVTSWIAERPEDFATAFVLIWKKFFNHGWTRMDTDEKQSTARPKSPGATGR